MRKRADRYIVLKVHYSELQERLKAAEECGLCWLILKSPDKNTARVALFFDENGLLNYLSFVYGDIADDIRAELDRFHSGNSESLSDESAALETLKRISDILGDR